MILNVQESAGEPVPLEKEAAVQVSKLPICSGHLRTYLACLRPSKVNQSPPAHHLPLSSLENKLDVNSHFSRQGDGLPPEVARKLDVSPFVTQHSNLLV